MKRYQLDPGKLSKTKMNIILLYGITAVIMVIIIVWLSWEKLMEKDLLSMVVIPIMLGLFVYSAVRAIRQREAFWKSYELMIDENGLTQKQPLFPDLYISKNEVISIKEEKFGLVVSSEKYNNLLGITKNLSDADYEEVKSILTSWIKPDGVEAGSSDQKI
jgi:hypothetical protein